MLNQEELLIKIMQLLDIDMKGIKLKQTLEKERFITQEESNKKYQEHLELIFDALNLDKQNIELIKIFQELRDLYKPIYNELLQYKTEDNIKKINWIILKRLVVPFLAYRFASLDSDYNERIDKNMPGGIFWYLPNTEDYSDIKMPIEYLMNWWLDLYGKGLDSLCNEIDEDANETQAVSSKDILKPWKSNSVIPDSKSLKVYLSKDLNYTGIFQPIDTVAIQPNYKNAINFIQKTKQLTLEKLKKELPDHRILDKIFSASRINVSDKKKFIQYVKERWSKPTKETILTKFLIARALQDVYRKLIIYFELKNSNDIEENKILQLVYQYGILYNMQMDRLKNKLKDNDLYYEMIQPFYNPINRIIETIAGDITIELTNPDSEENILEDNYLVKIAVYYEQMDKRFKKACEEQEKFNNYFHKEFDDIDKKIKDYEALYNEAFFKKLDKEIDFKVLMNLYKIYQVKNYLKAEKICFQMSKTAKDISQEIQALSKLVMLYCDISQQDNQSNFNEAKHLLEQLLLLLESQENTVKAHEKDILFIKANFHFKVREFNESLKYCNEFFDLYVNKVKKEYFSDMIVHLAAYSAYAIEDNDKLKQYNGYLKKQNLQEIKTQQSLPFPIYFYN